MSRQNGSEDDGQEDDFLDKDDASSDEEELDCEGFTEDTYSAAIVSLIKDSQRIARGSGHRGLRVARIVLHLLLLLVNIGIQVFLLFNIKWYVTAKAVHDIRIAYDEYERSMYPGHFELNSHGKARGIGGLTGGNFQAGVFDTLSDEAQASVCRIPFSKPYFFSVILLIWTLTMTSEFRTIIQLFSRLILSSNRVTTMAKATKPHDGPEELIAGLTLGVKAFITIFMLLPRLIVALVLLWLGCRWLAATTNFNDIILNAVALEFIMSLNELLYKSVVPARNQREVGYLKIDVEHEGQSPSPMSFLVPFMWFLLALAWVWMYFYMFQGVLPGYNWDVAGVCEAWIAKRYSVD